jgi:cereblon
LQIRRMLEEWQQQAQFTCRTCGRQIGLLSDTIDDVSELGPSGTFVNAHGYLHSITCVSQVTLEAVECIGQPTTEFSWFPSYAWTCAQCCCGEHVGWRFTRASGNGPKVFWGLTHASLRSSSVGGSYAIHDDGVVVDDEDDNDDNVDDEHSH